MTTPALQALMEINRHNRIANQFAEYINSNAKCQFRKLFASDETYSFVGSGYMIVRYIPEGNWEVFRIDKKPGLLFDATNMFDMVNRLNLFLEFDTDSDE